MNEIPVSENHLHKLQQLTTFKKVQSLKDHKTIFT